MDLWLLTAKCKIHLALNLLLVHFEDFACLVLNTVVADMLQGNAHKLLCDVQDLKDIQHFY